jgi:hypothetical protein
MLTFIELMNIHVLQWLIEASRWRQEWRYPDATDKMFTVQMIQPQVEINFYAFDQLLTSHAWLCIIYSSLFNILTDYWCLLVVRLVSKWTMYSTALWWVWLSVHTCRTQRLSLIHLLVFHQSTSPWRDCSPSRIARFNHPPFHPRRRTSGRTEAKANTNTPEHWETNSLLKLMMWNLLFYRCTHSTVQRTMCDDDAYCSLLSAARTE